MGYAEVIMKIEYVGGTLWVESSDLPSLLWRYTRRSVKKSRKDPSKMNMRKFVAKELVSLIVNRWKSIRLSESVRIPSSGDY